MRDKSLRMAVVLLAVGWVPVFVIDAVNGLRAEPHYSHFAFNTLGLALICTFAAVILLIVSAIRFLLGYGQAN